MGEGFGVKSDCRDEMLELLGVELVDLVNEEVDAFPEIYERTSENEWALRQ
jgi:hypothetical protein